MSQWQWNHSQDPAVGLFPDRPGYHHNMKLASAPWRWLAGIIDWGFVYGIPTSLVIDTTHDQGAGMIVGLAVALFNSGFLAAKTTQSLGKKLCGIRFVQVRLDRQHEPYVTYVPVWVAILRLFLHVFDYLPFAIGFWLIPIISRGRGTIADFMCRTLCYRDKGLPDPVHFTGGPRDWP